MLSQTNIIEFSQLFNGAREFYGVTVVGDIVNGKAQSTSTCVHESVSPVAFDKHLRGELSIGVSPLKADNTVEFGAIDIDNYTGDLFSIVRAIYDYELPICPCYSKSKKLHLYFFFELGTSAEDAFNIMKWYASALGCDKKVEIFPKQLSRSTKNKAYSWINLPYYKSSDEENHRKMIHRDGTYATIDEFIVRAKNCKQTIEWHKAQISYIPCFDAPPCILTSLLLNDIGQGNRNNWLFCVGVYLRLKDEACDLATELSAINERLPDPLPSDELRNTVLKSLEKGSYFYMCATMQHCDKSSCQRLEYGVGSAKSTGLSYGDLTQIMTDPPTYEWLINGQKMTFYSEKDLLAQTEFRALCLRYLHLVPRKIDDPHWSKIVSRACENIKVVYPDTKGGDFAGGSRFYDLMCKYFGDKRKAANMSQIALGRVYDDTERGEYVFTANSFISFIVDTHGFKGLTDMEMRTRLSELGAYKVGNVWRMPKNSINIADVQQDSIDIDFTDTSAESEDF